MLFVFNIICETYLHIHTEHSFNQSVCRVHKFSECILNSFFASVAWFSVYLLNVYIHIVTSVYFLMDTRYIQMHFHFESVTKMDSVSSCCFFFSVCFSALRHFHSFKTFVRFSHSFNLNDVQVYFFSSLFSFTFLSLRLWFRFAWHSNWQQIR